MKKIALSLITISLVIIAVLQYLNWAKFRYDKQHYDYIVETDSLDLDYHDPEIVTLYFESAFEIGALARSAWFNQNIDVKLPDSTDQQHLNAAKRYDELWKTATELEVKLRDSWRLKQEGFTNEAIAEMERLEISDRLYIYKFEKFTEGKIFDINSVGDEVWELQVMLNQLGYDQVPINGRYDGATKNAVQQFQITKNIYPSGKAEYKTLYQLAQETENVGGTFSSNGGEKQRIKRREEVMDRAASLEEIGRRR